MATDVSVMQTKRKPAHVFVSALCAGAVALAGTACTGSNGDSDDDNPSPGAVLDRIEDISVYPDDTSELFEIDESGFTVWETDAGFTHISFAIVLSNTSDTHAAVNTEISVSWFDDNDVQVSGPRESFELSWIAPGARVVLSDSAWIDDEPVDFELDFPQLGEAEANRWVEYDALTVDGQMEVTGARFYQEDLSESTVEANVDIESTLPWELTSVWLLGLWRDADGELIGGSSYVSSYVDIAPGEQTSDFTESNDDVPDSVDFDESEFLAQALSATRGISLNDVETDD